MAAFVIMVLVGLVIAYLVVHEKKAVRSYSMNRQYLVSAALLFRQESIRLEEESRQAKAGNGPDAGFAYACLELSNHYRMLEGLFMKLGNTKIYNRIDLF